MSGRAAPLRSAASLTASATCSCTFGSSASGTSSDCSARSAIARAAASYISRLMSSAPASSAPRKMPGYPSTLLTIEPSEAKAAPAASASSGRISGSGLVRAG